ncbi:MgtC/SapB transporter [Rhodopseudomonas palustris HaA2]|uniref:Protein MgtC n=1 Tax=Rhodopseudomonas palustris (strain HaA2) TaxID=316058 RepID=Q2IUR4_RHOP2|nr:MgtC/SapB family protein [Rhodopseudomonas palustris]ABD08046.1 MgtC/SapB transporter [Rhodopseudomonas palustris HaA2]
MLPWWEMLLRLGVAAVAGGLIGLNRDLQGKPIGMRTLALVGVASALLVALADQSADLDHVSDPTSRVIQGILTGIGFLGAGVIVHTGGRHDVHGLTTAACTWLTACIGIACGAGQWPGVLAAMAITLAVLIGGHRLEGLLHRLLGGKDSEGGGDETKSKGSPAVED